MDIYGNIIKKTYSNFFKTFNFLGIKIVKQLFSVKNGAFVYRFEDTRFSFLEEEFDSPMRYKVTPIKLIWG